MQSLGLIETKGMALGIEAVDSAMKSANVELLGYELAKGEGRTLFKIVGDVGAVKAAVDAAKSLVAGKNGFISTRVIPRPSRSLEPMIYTAETVGIRNEDKLQSVPHNPESPEVPVALQEAESPVVPVAPQEAESTEVPAAPQEAESPEVPAASQEAESPEVPAAPQEAESPEVPAASQEAKPPEAEAVSVEKTENKKTKKKKK